MEKKGKRGMIFNCRFCCATKFVLLFFKYGFKLRVILFCFYYLCEKLRYVQSSFLSTLLCVCVSIIFIIFLMLLFLFLFFGFFF